MTLIRSSIVSAIFLRAASIAIAHTNADSAESFSSRLQVNVRLSSLRLYGPESSGEMAWIFCVFLKQPVGLVSQL